MVRPKNALKYKPEFANRAAIACQVGLTDYELAIVFGVSNTTIVRWRHQHPEFAEALQAGKALADDRVERSLYHRAIGYSYEAEEIFVRPGLVKVTTKKDGTKVVERGGPETIRVKTIKHVPPDVTATIFWLKNRRRDQWRDVHKHEVGPAGAFDHMSPEELQASIIEDIQALDIRIPKALPAPKAQGVAPKKG